MAPEISVVQSVWNQNRLSSKADLEILSSVPRKEINTKVEDNFVAHTGHRICIILSPDVGDMVPARKGCESEKSGRGWFYGNQVCFSRGSRARKGGACPKAPQGHKYIPLGAPGWLPIDIHSSESRRRSAQGGGCRGLAAAPPELEDGEDWSSWDASTTFSGTMLSILME
jgi:hypothetical protein